MDIDYLSSRMSEERDRAAEAETPQARAAHIALAEQYQAEIDRLQSNHNSRNGTFATA